MDRCGGETAFGVRYPVAMLTYAQHVPLRVCLTAKTRIIAKATSTTSGNPNFTSAKVTKVTP
jgi:hypothetical protein